MGIIQEGFKIRITKMISMMNKVVEIRENYFNFYSFSDNHMVINPAGKN